MAIKTGTAGKDILVGTDAIDFISGLAGDDQLTGGKGADTIDGGDGIDTARYDTAAQGVNVDLLNFRGTAGDARGDQLFNIENVVGSQFADVIRGDDRDNVLTGLGGADTLIGGGGIDTVDYAASKQGIKMSLLTGIGFVGGDAVGDTYVGIENVTGSAFDDELEGDGFANVLSGGAGSDTLFGNGGKDTLKGGAGDDVLVGGAGADILDGGAGDDTVDYSSSAGFVHVDLSTGKGFFFDAAGDTFAAIDRVVGSGSGDTLTGNDLRNFLSGGAGADFLFGLGGNDIIAGGAGADFMQGGDGLDILMYLGSGERVIVNLADGEGAFGDAEGDMFGGFEGVVGSSFNDNLVGDGGPNTLDGRSGDDSLVGGGGDDVLIGGIGDDTLLGGAGADRFVYQVTDQKKGGGRDLIKDFTHDVDRIDLSGIDAKAGTSGNQAFSFIGGKAFTAEGQVRAFFDGVNTIVQVNTAGAAGAESEIALSGPVTVTAGDFML